MSSKPKAIELWVYHKHTQYLQISLKNPSDEFLLNTLNKTMTQPALKNPFYRRYFIASGFATLGIWMVRFLFGWLVWQSTESFFWVGVASTGLLIPSLIVTPIAGVIADRIDVSKGIVLWLVILCFVTAMTGFVLFTFGLEFWLLLIMMFVFGIIASAGSPLRMSLVPNLVTKEELPNAIGLGAILFNTSRIIAPMMAAFGLTLLVPTILFFVCMGAFGIAGLICIGLPSLNNMGRKKHHNGWQDFKQGLNFCWQDPAVRLLLLLTLASSQVGMTFLELLPALSASLTSGSASDLALLTGCAGAGSIVSGWVISQQRGQNEWLVRFLWLSLLLTGVLLLPLNLDLPVWVVGGVIATMSGLMTIFGTSTQTILQLRIPDTKRGRVMSLWITIGVSGSALGTLIFGAWAEWVGVNIMLATMILISLLSALCLYIQRNRFLGE